jgi:hypothetical protein
MEAIGRQLLEIIDPGVPGRAPQNGTRLWNEAFPILGIAAPPGVVPARASAGRAALHPPRQHGAALLSFRPQCHDRIDARGAK